MENFDDFATVLVLPEGAKNHETRRSKKGKDPDRRGGDPGPGS
jgi:hypothetical protein